MRSKLTAAVVVLLHMLSPVVFGEGGSKPESHLELMLRIDGKEHRWRDPISMELIVKNPSKIDAQLTFSSAQKYDFIVKKGQEEIWRWGSGKVFAMMMDQIVLPPGESLQYTETWDQKDNEGETVLPGKYELAGVLKTYPEIVTQPVVVEIKADPS